jgi:putative DNA primase/helicase
MADTIRIKKHTADFKGQQGVNRYLLLADDFLHSHPEILFWTERNETKKGMFYEYQGGVYVTVSSLDVEQRLLNHTPSSPDIAIPSNLPHCKFQEVMRFIRIRRFFYREVFNPVGIVNFKNGLFYVDSMELKEHSMDVLTTNQLPYDYDRNAECPNFMKALSDAVDNDEIKIRVIQEFAGYCLMHSKKYEKALFLIGASGSGKSTVLDGIEAMLGRKNVSHTSMEQLCQAQYAGNFIDKIANIDREIPKNITGYEASLNKIISGEDITVNTKYLPSYDARPNCKIIFAANDMPKISDTSNALFRRMILIDFDNVIADDVIDRDLKDRVATEGAGIFNFALEGLKRLNKQGAFTISEEVKENLLSLREQNNNVFYFIREKYRFDANDDAFVILDDLYIEYKIFCDTVGAKGVCKRTVFSKELRKTFGKSIDIKSKRFGGIIRRVVCGIRDKGESSQQRAIQKGQMEWN